MADQAIEAAVPRTVEGAEVEAFQTGQVVTISFGHFVHDVFSGFLPALLPLLIERLSLTLTMGGALSSIMQAPAVLNPFIGYVAERASLRYFIILAPGVTATLMTLTGIMPGYAPLALLLFCVGVTVAAFHAPAPAMVARISGRQVGKGMSIFMAGGELGRTVGPLLAVWGVSMWGLEGIWRLAAIGWGTSAVLYLRLRHVAARPGPPPDLRAMFPSARRLFGPMLVVVILRGFLLVSLAVYLPTFLEAEGAALWAAGAALLLWELAGVAGALTSGPISDRVGRKPVLAVTMAVPAALMLVFLNVEGWLRVPLLLGMGVTLLSTQPVLMATVQDQMPEHRAIANGIFMTIMFAVQLLATLVIGAAGDAFGLRAAFFGSALAAFLAIPAIFWLPGEHTGV